MIWRPHAANLGPAGEFELRIVCLIKRDVNPKTLNPSKNAV